MSELPDKQNSPPVEGWQAKPDGVVPKLRFPEFRDEPGWEAQRLGDLATFYNGRAYKQEELLEKGKYKILRVGNFFTNVNWYFSDLELEENKYCENGDLLYAWSASFGPRIWIGEKVIYHYHIWKVVEKRDIQRKFLFIILDDETKKITTRSANGLGLMHLKKVSVENWKCNFPNKEEQKKIADCLSSLDDLITAQTQKLGAIKTHKKALIQQLFPAEGETVPKLRFTEFRDGERWEAYNFYDLLDNVLDFRGRTPLKLGMNWGGGEIISLSANNVKNGYIDFNTECNLGNEKLYEKWMGKITLAKGDIVFTTEAPLGNALQIPDDRKYILSQRVIALKVKKSVNSSFLIQLIWSSRFQKIIERLSTGSTAKGINQKNLKKLIVRIPNLDEQIKVAGCLSYLDEAVREQSLKIKLLNLHKKGLMQQLFPQVDNVPS